MTKPLKAVIPQRMNANWRDAILQECDCCNQYRRTVKASDGTAICASCADGYYTDQLYHNLEIAMARIAELEASQLTVKLPELCMGVVQSGKAVMVPYAGGHWLNKTAVIEAIRAAGGTVQEAK